VTYWAYGFTNRTAGYFAPDKGRAAGAIRSLSGNARFFAATHAAQAFPG
jgi:hypothetical protein